MPNKLTLIDNSTYQPLATKLRPESWELYLSKEALTPALLKFLQEGKGIPPSLIIWGPPGSGKTTLAKLIGKTFDLEFEPFSAVLGGVKEVREIVTRAEKQNNPTILFVDEIHRFNRSQQDAFLPHVESGRIILIGATTENPSFYLTTALLSRCKVIVLPPLNEKDSLALINRAVTELDLEIEKNAVAALVHYGGGDARRILNAIEGLENLHPKPKIITQQLLSDYLGKRESFKYDRAGEEHYNMASAFIKSLRGTDPDAALYWGFRMLEAGEDARFLIRRMIIFASEDIGNADPRALQLAISTADAFERIGLPEGRIPLAHCITFLATAPKSNRSYTAMNKTLALIKRYPDAPVPLHLRNSPTKLMKDLNYGADYQYPHDSEHGFVKEKYLPDEISSEPLYQPKDSGYEKTIKERMDFFKKV